MRSEDAVGGDAERVLERTHAATPMGALAAAGGTAVAAAGARALALEHRTGAQAERLARLRADDPVDGQPVLALVALDGPLGLRSEHAVGRDAEGLLERAHVVLRLRGLGARRAGIGRRRRAERGEQRRKGEHEQCCLSGLRHFVGAYEVS